MAISLPLEKMTFAEKQEAIELLWHDLYGEDEPLPIPAWQIEALKEREAATARGENPIVDFDVAINELLKEFKCE